MSPGIRLSVVALAVLALTGCSKQNSLTTQPLADLSGAGATIAAQNVVTLPAGSSDGLAAAIAAAGPGGKVIVAAGNHTESGSVLITQNVTIEGEPGAKVISTSNPVLVAGTPVEPALHVKGAAGVVISGLELVPAGAIGGTGILLEHAPGSIVRGNTIREYQYGVLLHEGDRTWIDGNTVVASAAWQTAQIPEALGITVINGEKVKVTNNDVSQGLFNIWPCDKDGILQGNRVHDGYIGIILCCVPEESMMLPGGEMVGAETPSEKWLCKRNDARNNFDAGYLVIDGANNTLLVEKPAANNGTYDIQLNGGSYSPGLLAPTSLRNEPTPRSEAPEAAPDW